MNQDLDQKAYEAFMALADSHSVPSVLYRPKIYRDGNAWCALYGDDITTGVVGLGESPEEAVRAFDKAWCELIAKDKK